MPHCSLASLLRWVPTPPPTGSELCPLPGSPECWGRAGTRHTHLVICAEAVHLLVEHGHPQVLAEELEDIQLLPEAQSLLGQSTGQAEDPREELGSVRLPALGSR